MRSNPPLSLSSAPAANAAALTRGWSFLETAVRDAGLRPKSVNDCLQLAARRLDGRGQLSANDVRGVRFPRLLIFQRATTRTWSMKFSTRSRRRSPPSTAADRGSLGTVPS